MEWSLSVWKLDDFFPCQRRDLCVACPTPQSWFDSRKFSFQLESGFGKETVECRSGVERLQDCTSEELRLPASAGTHSGAEQEGVFQDGTIQRFHS